MHLINDIKARKKYDFNYKIKPSFVVKIYTQFLLVCWKNYIKKKKRTKLV